jgi:hypothetical protein
MGPFIILAVFLSSIANAQDVPPPPKPKDDGPSLEVTMKFIQDKLREIGRMNYVVYTHDNTNGNDVSNKFSTEANNVQASVADCRIDFHWSASRNGEALDDRDISFFLKNVQEIVVLTREQELDQIDAAAGHPGFSSRVEPPIFMLQAKRSNGMHAFGFFDESLANRVAKALVHAVELCGGGSKEPF